VISLPESLVDAEGCAPNGAGAVPDEAEEYLTRSGVFAEMRDGDDRV
jgi:hypothetical protein